MAEDARRDSAMDRLGMDARWEARMLTEGKPITDAQRDALLTELRTYRDTHLVEDKPVSWAKLATYIGVSSSVLTETVKGKYAGDVEGVLRKIDQFLAGEAQAAKRTDIRGFARIKITDDIVAAINQTLVRRSIGVITGEPGSGKSMHARWFRDKHDGAILITSDDTDRDAKFVIDALHAELRLAHTPYTRDKKRMIEAYLQTHTNTVILVDEAQKLTNDALEIIRAFHDKSDIDCRRNVPVILFGDHHFYKVVVRSRGGEKTPFSPQITSRMFPVLSIESQCTDVDDDGQPIPGTVFTREDIERIVRNSRLKLVRPEALAFATRLANVHGHGRLRLASRVLEIAIDSKAGPQVTVEDLRSALDLFLGPSESKLVLTAIDDGRASRRVAAAG